MSDLSVQIRVTSIRSRGLANRGVIFAGDTDNGQTYVAVCSYRLVPDASVLDKGQLWQITGQAVRRDYIVNGFKRSEVQIDAKAAELLCPSGHNLIGWIAGCSDAVGIGQVKATKLYQRFGPSLVDLIEKRDVAALSFVLNEEAAVLLCEAFAKHKVANTLLWLDQVDINRRIGSRVVSFYKNAAQEKIQSNPYVLLSFEASWKAVDELAQVRFKVMSNDPRRLEAAIEECLYRCLKRGHTCLPADEVHAALIRLLDSRPLARQALDIAQQSAQFVRLGDFYQPSGLAIIEDYLAKRFVQMVKGEDSMGQCGMFTQIKTDPVSVESAIEMYEQSHAFALSAEQRSAVQICSNSHLGLILGGAGTGKTTVLKALYKALASLDGGVMIYQLAPTGRAAQKMAQATNLVSSTIHSFLLKVQPADIAMGSVVVIDEMSMVDVILMYRLLRHLPIGVRLILVGDPSQLNPVGPGLVLHALANHSLIPQIELKVVQRQTSASGIPQVAAAIRAHKVPVWAEYTGKPDVGVSFVPCSEADLQSTCERVYVELDGRGVDYTVEILSMTNSGFGGVESMNAGLCLAFQAKAKRISCFDPEFGVIGATTLDRLPLSVGDLVMFTKNDYPLGLRNGSLGTILQTLHVESENDPCCVCDFEGEKFELCSLQIQALSHAYCITVHKSQGSQFKRVIVPIRASHGLDQALIYTAVTRGVDQVVLVGDEQSALHAIKYPPASAGRHTTLAARMLENST